MTNFHYTNKRGESVFPYFLFRELNPDRIKGLPAKTHLSRRQRRIRNGRITEKQA